MSRGPTSARGHRRSRAVLRLDQRGEGRPLAGVGRTEGRRLPGASAGCFWEGLSGWGRVWVGRDGRGGSSCSPEKSGVQDLASGSPPGRRPPCRCFCAGGFGTAFASAVPRLQGLSTQSHLSLCLASHCPVGLVFFSVPLLRNVIAEFPSWRSGNDSDEYP